MKWLFAILVMLNIIVFANVVTKKMQQADAGKEVVMVKETPTTDSKDETVDWTIEDNGGITEASTIETKAVTHKKVVKETEKTDKKTAKETEDDRKEARRLASCTASVTLPEDAYHRLKGMLNRWPNAANKVVGKNENADAMGRQYHVVFASNGDANEAAMEAISKGFKAQSTGNIVTLGIFKERSHAEQLQNRARSAGYPQANVVERSAGSGGQNLTSVKYQVLFLQVDDAAAKDIAQIVQPYSKLARGECKR